jgi:hypothetical protein
VAFGRTDTHLSGDFGREINRKKKQKNSKEFKKNSKKIQKNSKAHFFCFVRGTRTKP